MTLFEDNTHVFILRIWREPREIEGAAPEWRGTIERIPDGERRSVRTLDEITAFVVRHLAMMGINPPS